MLLVLVEDSKGAVRVSWSRDDRQPIGRCVDRHIGSCVGRRVAHGYTVSTELPTRRVLECGTGSHVLHREPRLILRENTCFQVLTFKLVELTWFPAREIMKMNKIVNSTE